MPKSRSIQTKLMRIMATVASLALATAVFGIAMINQLAHDTELILDEYVPISRCCEQALLAVQQGAVYMHRARMIQDPEKMDELRILSGRFRQSMVRFDMFSQAVLRGSRSEAFAQSYDGLTLQSWRRAGWDRKLTVPPASGSIHQAVELADSHYGDFAMSAQAVFRIQRRILRLRLEGKTDQIAQEEIALDQNLHQAEQAARQISETLEKGAIETIHDELRIARQDVQQTKNFTRWALLLFSGIIFGVALALGRAFFLRALVRPIIRLREGTELVGAGDLTHRVGTDSQDEIGGLSRAFDRMTESLQGTRRRLEGEIAERHYAEEEALRRAAILEGVNRVLLTGLTCRTEEEIAETCLDVAEQLTDSRFGYIGQLNEAGLFDILAISNPGWDACAISQDQARKSIINMPIRGVDRSTLKEGRSRIVNDPVGHPDHIEMPEGHPPIICLLGVPLKQAGKTIGMIALADKPSGYSPADQETVELLAVAFVETLMRRRAEEAVIRARDELENRVRQRTAELERSNRDLEQFAYVASHDLQEPLRIVAGYVQLLDRRYRDKLDADADEFIQFAVDGARRMQQLIDDLLAYSRVGPQGKQFAPVDMNEVADEALKNLHDAIDQSEGRVTRDPLPNVRGDRGQLVQLLQNLVGNGLKFHAQQAPHVHLSAEKEDGRWRFTVRDNGIGIDPKFQQRVFQIFQRLHTRDQYPGTGIGLAICKRIVERHGGQIGFESRPDQGTTFYFTIADGGTGL